MDLQLGRMTRAGRRASWLDTAREWLPRGSQLPDDVWAGRHRGILILLTETDQKGALAFAEKLRIGVEKLRLRGKGGVTVSIGVATYPGHGRDVDSLIRQADAALYRCKGEGRNRVAMADGGGSPGGAARVSSG